MELPPGDHEARLKHLRGIHVKQYGPPEDGCWTWTGPVVRGDYGHMGREWNESTGTVKTILAHRFTYELFKGPIPPGYEVDHLCRNRRCINPTHLEAVTPIENKRRAAAAALADRIAADSQAAIDEWRAQMKAERFSRNLTQAQVAVHLGMTAAAYGTWETGLRRGTPARRAEMLNVVRQIPAIPHGGQRGPREKAIRLPRPRLGA